ncbi:hypothetical protein [Bacillus sp. N1-1]|uniref:hypothetical protein n=1 Tax=Bacillus sp. N1-1 TaxID=2682541 RepID=UPI001318CEE5|nr:hypothetical protein [Bacillus sp. N1-1]QHA91325.1 hypothetical protein GNK04_07765 [Bacillus sp. N1-1]
MHPEIKKHFKGLEAEDKTVQYEAFQALLQVTKSEVEWAYEVWDELVEGLSSKNNHTRSRCAQLLSQLAISDPEKRILVDFPKLWAVTKDPKFVTARHSFQSIWRVGLAGEEQKVIVMGHLITRFEQCYQEKNGTLIRSDILQSLHSLYEEVKEQEIKERALQLIEFVDDPKYQKKYRAIWK